MLLGARLIATAAGAELPVLRVPGWDDVPDLVHGFLTRHGGVSAGPFASLNLSSQVGDDVDAVSENWRRVGVEATAGTPVVTMRQVHGATVVEVTAVPVEAREADAMATRVRGLILGVLTADCVPILLLAPAHGAVAAVHAGWRGTVAGVAARAVEHLSATFAVPPSELHAALGPSIDGCCYETDVRVGEDLERQWGSLPGVVQHRAAGKVRLDLRAGNAAVLVKCGVSRANVVRVGACTRCARQDYFSHRGDGGRTGRQLSFIGWRADSTRSD